MLRRSYEIAVLDLGISLGSISLRSIDDVHYIIYELVNLCTDTGATMVAGVFPAPIQAFLHMSCDTGFSIPCFASWNVMRALEGEKPSFEHKQFVLVGEMYTDYLSKVLKPFDHVAYLKWRNRANPNHV